MSAMEQPALRSGRITVWWSPVSTSADSAMKCTPQNTMNSASSLLLGEHREAVAVAAGVGPADHLVALVVVAEDEHPVAEGRLGGLDAGARARLGCAGVALVERCLEPQHVVGVLHVWGSGCGRRGQPGRLSRGDVVPGTRYVAGYRAGTVSVAAAPGRDVMHGASSSDARGVATRDVDAARRWSPRSRPAGAPRRCDRGHQGLDGRELAGDESCAPSARRRTRPAPGPPAGSGSHTGARPRPRFSAQVHEQVRRAPATAPRPAQSGVVAHECAHADQDTTTMTGLQTSIAVLR